MTSTDIARAITDLLFTPGLDLAEALERHFTPDYRQRTDGVWSDRTSCPAHRPPPHPDPRRTGRGPRRTPHGLRYADRHVVNVAKPNGSTFRTEVYLFAEFAPDGRFHRVEETTLLITGHSDERGTSGSSGDMDRPPKTPRNRPREAPTPTPPELGPVTCRSGRPISGSSVAQGGMGAAMVSVGERLSSARVRAFIGRDEELGRFGEALAGDPQAPFAFYVFGPGGIGKSTLLRRLADHARSAGRLLVELDGRFVSRDPADFERAAGPFLDVPGTVLFVDSFEHCQWLESWLWHHFLPRAADGTLVVLAGRLAPQPQWTADPAWAGLLHVTELEPFSEEQARSLLAAAQLRPELRNRVLRFAGGNPLALSLAAAAGSTGCGEEEIWAPSADVLRTLLAGLIGEVPTAAHRRALEVAAQAYSTSEELLDAVLPEEDAHLLFSWLRDLPFMEPTHGGSTRTTPHARRCPPTCAGVLPTRSRRCASAWRTSTCAFCARHPRSGCGPSPTSSSTCSGRGRPWPGYGTWSREDEVHDRPLHPDDIDVVLRMAEGDRGGRLRGTGALLGTAPAAGFQRLPSRELGPDRGVHGPAGSAGPSRPQDLATDPVVRGSVGSTPMPPPR